MTNFLRSVQSADVPYRLAFAATVRKQAHKNDEEAAMAYRHALAGIVHFFGRLPFADEALNEEQHHAYEACHRLFKVLDEPEVEETSEEE